MLHELAKAPFLGFEKESLKFLKDLSNSKNNNKDWFDKHRDIYEDYLKQPMRDLIDTLAVEINKIDPDIVVSYKSIFRINRDVRFSKNKMPYKNLYSAAFAFGRVKSAEIPQFYFHFDPNEFIFAAGQYSMDNDYLKKIRTAISSNFKSYRSIVAKKDFVKAFGAVAGESLTKLPKGYDNVITDKTDPQLISALKMKQYYVFKTYKAEVVLNDKLIDKITDNIELSYDFTKFLHNATK
ncbi:MAG: DUF2461 domain-containing protein [Ignavibacteria bacterium]|nr:DUF2461 domain-containing protein [Ignavibacteria bacterium]